MQKFMTKVNEAKVEYYKQKEYLENRIELRQQQIERLQKRRDKTDSCFPNRAGGSGCGC